MGLNVVKSESLFIFVLKEVTDFLRQYLQTLPQLYVIHVPLFLFYIPQEPVRCLDPSILSSDILNLFLSVPLPGIGLLHVCAKPMSPPQKVRPLLVFFNQMSSNCQNIIHCTYMCNIILLKFHNFLFLSLIE